MAKGHWSVLIGSYGVPEPTTKRLLRALAATEASAVAFCRLLDLWARNEPDPCTPARREAALRRAAERVETALSALDEPLGRFLLELEPERSEARSWYGEPGAGELVEWEQVLRCAGVHAAPHRVTRAYLELAVFVRALEGLTSAAGLGAPPDRSSLWAGLFDLRENLLSGTIDDLRALAA